MDSDTEQYILLLLADSNLPSGSFVASSGFESYLKHGFAYESKNLPEATIGFVKNSLHSNAHMTLPFVSNAHILVDSLRKEGVEGREKTLERLKELDNELHIMTLNEVSRRASMAQGVALLTLYSKGFTRPPSAPLTSIDGPGSEEDLFKPLVDEFKLFVRREDTLGHLPICWGILTAALGLTLERAQFLHLFLHARSILSAAVRLNSIGPYASQQMLLHQVRPLVDAAYEESRHLRVWSDDPDNEGPTTTWPLGEIVIARHDLLQSRIFNS